MKIWIRNSAGEQILYDLERLNKEIMDKKINPETTYCWHEDLPNWILVSKILPPQFKANTVKPIEQTCVSNSAIPENKYSLKAIFSFVFILLQFPFLQQKSPLWLGSLLLAIILGVIASSDFKKNKNLKGKGFLNAARFIFWTQLLLVIVVSVKIFLLPTINKTIEASKAPLQSTSNSTNSHSNTVVENNLCNPNLTENYSSNNIILTNDNPKDDLLWESNYQAALQKSSSLNRNLLIYFHASWSSFCQDIDKEIISSDKFKEYASNNIVLLKFEYPYGKYPDTVTRLEKTTYHVEGFPTFVLLSPDGQILRKHTGSTSNGFEGFKQWIEEGTDNDKSSSLTPISVWENNVTNFDSVHTPKNY